MTLKITPRAEQVEEEEEWEKEEGCGFGAGVLAQNILPVFHKTPITTSSSKPPGGHLIREGWSSKAANWRGVPWCNNGEIFDLISASRTTSLSGTCLQAAFLDALRTGRRPEDIRSSG